MMILLLFLGRLLICLSTRLFFLSLLLIFLRLSFQVYTKKTKSSKNLDSKSAKKLSASSIINLILDFTNWTPKNPGECAVPFQGCGRGATCWRFRRGSNNWNGNGICVPDNVCLPGGGGGGTWSRRVGADAVFAMEDMCCHGTRFVCSNNIFTPYCVCES